MKKKSLLAGFGLGLLAGLLVLGVLAAFSRGQADDKSSPIDVFFQAVTAVRSQYVKKDLDNTSLYYGAIRGLLASLKDPYTRFVEPKDYQEMQVHLRGAFSGIGIQIGIREGKLVVISPMEGTPAYKAGLKPLDVIVAIDDQSTEGMALEKAVGLIRGRNGSRVKLTVWRPDQNKTLKVTIVRSTITIDSARSKMLSPGLGYLRIITFENEDTAEVVRQNLEALKKAGARKLVLDLRNNGGGILQNALAISDLFLTKGTIVQTVDRDGDKRSFTAEPNDEILTGPVVVLVNEASASASEILAGALQDNQRAKLVGQRTFGKASVQNIKVLGDGSAILLTVAKYLTPSGRDISEKGINPDLEVALTDQKAGSQGPGGAKSAAGPDLGPDRIIEKTDSAADADLDLDKIIEKIDPAADRQLAKAIEVLEQAK